MLFFLKTHEQPDKICYAASVSLRTSHSFYVQLRLDISRTSMNYAFPFYFQGLDTQGADLYMTVHLLFPLGGPGDSLERKLHQTRNTKPR